MWKVWTCRSLRHGWLFATPGAVARQAPLFMGFSRPEHWSGLPSSAPGDLPDPGIEPRSPALQEDSLQSEPPGKPPNNVKRHSGMPFGATWLGSTGVPAGLTPPRVPWRTGLYWARWPLPLSCLPVSLLGGDSWFPLGGLRQWWFTKAGPWTSSINTTWELARSTQYQAHPRAPEPETLGLVTSDLCLNSPSQWRRCSCLRTTGLRPRPWFFFFKLKLHRINLLSAPRAFLKSMLPGPYAVTLRSILSTASARLGHRQHWQKRAQSVFHSFSELLSALPSFTFLSVSHSCQVLFPWSFNPLSL